MTTLETAEEFHARGGLPVELGVEKDNPRARVFWERCGFTYVGEDESEHRLRLA